MIYIDTSAILAVMARNDLHHQRAHEIWDKLLDSRRLLVCSNYILIETLSLLQSRIGMEAVRCFYADLYPLLDIEWVDAVTHRIGMESFAAADRRNLSIVDCISFTIMRKRGIRVVFTFDRHFAEHGFQCAELTSL